MLAARWLLLVDVVASELVALHKMTFASTDPLAAAAFCTRYLGATRLTATMLKDLGKVHGFLASIFGGGDAATSREFLAEALRIQQHLDRPAECETENIQRLMRDRPLDRPNNPEILTLDGDQIDVVLHDVEQQQHDA